MEFFRLRSNHSIRMMQCGELQVVIFWCLASPSMRTAQGKPCPCGTNTRECDDPFYGETFCYPKVDFWPLDQIIFSHLFECLNISYSDRTSPFYTGLGSECSPDETQSGVHTTHRVKRSKSMSWKISSWWEESASRQKIVAVPTWLLRLKEPTKCPVVCSENQDYCYVPNFDPKGNWIDTKAGRRSWRYPLIFQQAPFGKKRQVK